MADERTRRERGRLTVLAAAALFTWGCTERVVPYEGAPAGHPEGFRVVGPRDYLVERDENAVRFLAPPDAAKPALLRAEVALLPPGYPATVPPGAREAVVGVHTLRYTVQPAGESRERLSGRIAAFERAFRVTCEYERAGAEGREACLRTAAGLR